MKKLNIIISSVIISLASVFATSNHASAKNLERVVPIFYNAKQGNKVYFDDVTIKDHEVEFVVTTKQLKKIKSPKLKQSKFYMAKFGGRDGLTLKKIYTTSEKDVLKKHISTLSCKKSSKFIKDVKRYYASSKEVEKLRQVKGCKVKK